MLGFIVPWERNYSDSRVFLSLEWHVVVGCVNVEIDVMRFDVDTDKVQYAVSLRNKQVAGSQVTLIRLPLEKIHWIKRIEEALFVKERGGLMLQHVGVMRQS